MRELRIYRDDSDCYIFLTYDQELDSDSEKAMWTLDGYLYDLEPGDTLKIVCVR